MAAAFAGAADLAFGAVETATGFAAGAGAGSEPRRPTLRDSLLRNPSDELVPALADAAGVVLVTATIGSLFEFDEAKLNDDGAPSGARGIVA